MTRDERLIKQYYVRGLRDAYAHDAFDAFFDREDASLEGERMGIPAPRLSDWKNHDRVSATDLIRAHMYVGRPLRCDRSCGDRGFCLAMGFWKHPSTVHFAVHDRNGNRKKKKCAKAVGLKRKPNEWTPIKKKLLLQAPSIAELNVMVALFHSEDWLQAREGSETARLTTANCVLNCLNRNASLQSALATCLGQRSPANTEGEVLVQLDDEFFDAWMAVRSALGRGPQK